MAVPTKEHLWLLRLFLAHFWGDSHPASTNRCLTNTGNCIPFFGQWRACQDQANAHLLSCGDEHAGQETAASVKHSSFIAFTQ